MKIEKGTVVGSCECKYACWCEPLEVGDFAHVNAGSVVKAVGKVESFRKPEAGEVVLGYEVAKVKT